LAGLLLSAGFVAAGIVAWATSGDPSGSWLPLHLALAGGAGIAIGTMLPHFLTSLAAARPARAARRRAGLALLAVGVALAAAGMNGAGPSLAAAGGLLYAAGLLTTAWNGFAPARAGLGRRGGIVDAAYGLALLNGTAAVGLAVLMLGGVGDAPGQWAHLKPAHAWLNLVGFVSLIIAGTLVHLYPTVIGARIRVDRSLAVIVAGLGIGAPVVGLGYAARLDPVADLGVAFVAAGALALGWYAVRCRTGRGAWTTDLAWHRLAEWHFNAAIGWFGVAVLVLGWEPLRHGTDPAGWSLGSIWGPLVVGWALQALVGAWTHLVPAIGPGDAARHAVQRRWLARAALARLIAWNAGVAALSVGAWMAADPLALAGALLVGATMLASLVLLAGAVLARPVPRP
jgi:nitrite reductase (NO-forming)